MTTGENVGDDGDDIDNIAVTKTPQFTNTPQSTITAAAPVSLSTCSLEEDLNEATMIGGMDQATSVENPHKFLGR